MKKTLLMIITFLLTVNLFSQEVEKIGETRELVHYSRMNIYCPSDIFVDEVNNFLYCQTNSGKKQSKYKLNSSIDFVSEHDCYLRTVTDNLIILDNTEIHFSSIAIEIWKDKKHVISTNVSNGISFILKKDEGYIVYFVSEGGTPGAVDTTGKIYSNTEALAYLKEYDPEKYTESLSRAEELGLKAEFEKGNVLIWGKTYYSTPKILKAFWLKGKKGYLYSNFGSVVQYDLQGNGYQADFSIGSDYSDIVIVSPNGEWLIPPISIHKESSILKQKYEEDDFMGVSTSWYVGYGGNIYYYIAGEEYTEVFRIRRTWGNPDIYAMAINGYTEDNYGKYVTETLATMSKSDLRLLRNTIFALYGVHFKSEDLSAHFAKEVWYTDEGKTSGEVELPPHRQKLVEMIQELERK